MAIQKRFEAHLIKAIDELISFVNEHASKTDLVDSDWEKLRALDGNVESLRVLLKLDYPQVEDIAPWLRGSIDASFCRPFGYSRIILYQCGVRQSVASSIYNKNWIFRLRSLRSLAESIKQLPSHQENKNTKTKGKRGGKRKYPESLQKKAVQLWDSKMYKKYTELYDALCRIQLDKPSLEYLDQHGPEVMGGMIKSYKKSMLRREMPPRNK